MTRSSGIARKRIEIAGLVQGVGFRPFVYRIALRHSLAGFVLNDSGGVTIEVEGDAHAIDGFLAALRSELPPLARIDRLIATDCEAAGADGFVIRDSLAQTDRFALAPPDVGLCDECALEMGTPGNRRFGYPFTNCTNCGPRYSIISDIPYDRLRTTMRVFTMCARCQGEYENPLDRRFHAEPNACPECGPGLALLSAAQLAAGEPFAFEALNTADILSRTRRLLEGGAIVAIKGLGGFHLACNTASSAAVDLLRERKRRNGKAFALMVRDIQTAEAVCIVRDADRLLLTSRERPIVLMPRRVTAKVAQGVAPGNSRLGVMLPYTPLHHLLFGDSGLDMLVMTSANLSEEPIVCRNEDAWPRLHTLADYFLLHNRDICARVDDSVIQTFEDRAYPVRRSRGYAPQPINLSVSLAEVLAAGGELKNTLCLTKGRYAVLSQHLGDLENIETMGFFHETLGHLRSFFRASPVAIAHDLHPNYLSTRFALEESGLAPISIQHHHAHIASCMADNGISGTVIGVALDGSGYGSDGRIWGGEFLVCDFLDFERRGHLRYTPLPGGDTAIRQPWRSALACLRETFGDEMPLALPLFDRIPAAHLRVVDQMIARRINTVETSSCGRLFDAVSSLVGIRDEISYEGQAAIELEFAASEADESYAFEIEDGEPFRLDFRPTIAAIVSDTLRGVSAGIVSAQFHRTIANALVEACLRIRRSDRLSRVCLSGGTFQNLRLLAHAVQELRQQGFEVFVHHRVPPNDGGLALGQAVIASHRLLRR